MLAGGHDGFHILDSVELYSPNGTCQHNLAPLPAPAYGLVLAYVEALVSNCSSFHLCPDSGVRISLKYRFAYSILG